jgi:DNA-binding CsgD family transcriptional regulator
MRQSIRQSEFTRFLDAMRDHDVTDDLARVQAPTLVLAREHAGAYTLPIVGEVAAAIPSARLVVLPGNWLLPCTDDANSAFARGASREIISFMLEPRGGEVGSSAAAHNGSGQAAAHNGAALLSPREREVLALLSEGKTNAQIAKHLVVAPATASRHVHNILNKLGMSRRAEAAAYAARAGHAEIARR